MANSFGLTDFTTKSLGTALAAGALPFITTSYKGVTEWADPNGYGVNDNINVKRTGNATVSTGVAFTPEDIIDDVIPYTMSDNDIYNTGFNVNFRDIKTKVVGGKRAIIGSIDRNGNADANITRYIDDYVTPQLVPLKQKIETVIAGKLANTAFMCPIDDPNDMTKVDSYSDFSNVKRLMNEMSFPKQRYGVVTPAVSHRVSVSLRNSFDETMVRNITKDAYVGTAEKSNLAGFDLWESENIATHIAGSQSSTFTVASVTPDANGFISSIDVTGLDIGTAGVLKAGDLVKIAGPKLYNNSNKIALNTGLVITVKEDVTSDGSGNGTILLESKLSATGMHRNVDVLPATSDVCTLFPDHDKNFFYIPKGIMANPLNLGELDSVDQSRYVDMKSSIAITSYAQGLVTSGVNTYRTSMLVPTLAVGYYTVVLPSEVV